MSTGRAGPAPWGVDCRRNKPTELNFLHRSNEVLRTPQVLVGTTTRATSFPRHRAGEERVQVLYRQHCRQDIERSRYDGAPRRVMGHSCPRWTATRTLRDRSDARFRALPILALTRQSDDSGTREVLEARGLRLHRPTRSTPNNCSLNASVVIDRNTRSLHKRRQGNQHHVSGAVDRLPGMATFKRRRVLKRSHHRRNRPAMAMIP